MTDWFAHACARSVVMRAVRTSLFVGVVLVAINQGDTLLDGGSAALSWPKLVLTFLVPYAVSTSSSVASRREALAAGAGGEPREGAAS